MITQTPADTEAFLQFLTEQVANGEVEKTPEELPRIWRNDRAEAIGDIRQSIQNMEAGLGRPLREVDGKIRAKHNFPRDT